MCMRGFSLRDLNPLDGIRPAITDAEELHGIIDFWGDSFNTDVRSLSGDLSVPGRAVGATVTSRPEKNPEWPGHYGYDEGWMTFAPGFPKVTPSGISSSGWTLTPHTSVTFSIAARSDRKSVV
jgi:hypothetical protein